MIQIERWNRDSQIVFALLVLAAAATFFVDRAGHSTAATVAAIGTVLGIGLTGFVDFRLGRRLDIRLSRLDIRLGRLDIHLRRLDIRSRRLDIGLGRWLGRPTTWVFGLIGAAGAIWLASWGADGLSVLFIVAPYLYARIDRTRLADAITVAICVAAGIVAETRAGWRLAELPLIGGTVIAAIGLTLLLHRALQAIIDESIRQGTLIAELEVTRSELAAAHRAAGQAAGEIAERERLSREIHDTLAQGFTSLLMLIQTANAKLGTGAGSGSDGRHNGGLEKSASIDLAGAAGRLTLAEATARDNLAEARALVAALAPADLTNGTLDAAIRRISQRAARELDRPVDFDLTGAPRTVAMDRQVVLVRAAQEALANARRHAQATRVRVSLAYDETEVALTVVDDGTGFDPDTVDGYGLAGLRNRVEQIGGRIDLRTGPGQGTSIRVVVP